MRCMSTSSKATMEMFGTHTSYSMPGMPYLGGAPPGYSGFQQILVPSSSPGHPPQIGYIMPHFPYGAPQNPYLPAGHTSLKIDKDGKEGEGKEAGSMASYSQIPLVSYYPPNPYAAYLPAHYQMPDQSQVPDKNNPNKVENQPVPECGEEKVKVEDNSEQDESSKNVDLFNASSSCKV